MRSEIVPISLDEANAFILKHHRHHPHVIGAKFCLGVVFEGREELAGVATVGRCVARGLDDEWTLEVTRVATDGTANACSALYGACARAAFALGYRRLVTYVLESERGTSLRAAGWRVVAEVRGRTWSCASRPRVDKSALVDKVRWETERGGKQPVFERVRSDLRFESYADLLDGGDDEG